MPDQDVRAEWIAVDWGTSRLRAWAMQGATVLSQADSGDGMASLSSDQFESALLDQISPWLGSDPVQVVACGMVGARQGWAEAPYVAVPAKPLDTPPIKALTQDPRLQVHILPGLSQSRPADVMRGEETQIAGFLSLNPGWDGVLCLPGTHTKWAHVSAGEIVSFQTFMTGELFALLGAHSVLRHTIGTTGWDDTAFAEALEETRSRPEKLATQLFGLRAEDLLTGLSSETARARLSGLLIGAELAGARAYWLGQQVAVIGSSSATAPYVKALEAEGVPAMFASGDKMVLTGLIAAWRNLKPTH
jgi:2-dehydro-3-deoxygalactonokinase